MEKLCLVSVLTPTYNHVKFIAECIESVLSQNYSNWEMIIVDDGSTDGTGDVVRRYDDPRIKYHFQENKGILRLKENYNFALGQARGRYIGILEGDDVWEFDKLAKQVPLMQKYQPAVLYGRYKTIGAKGELVSIPKKVSGSIHRFSSEECLRKFLAGVGGGLTAFPVTVLIDEKLLRSHGGFQQPCYYPAVEHPTWLHLARVGSFLEVDEVFGSWRRHGTQATGNLGINLSEGVSRCNLDCFNDLSESERIKVDVTQQQVARNGKKFTARSYFSMGRYCLMRKEWGNACSYFRQGIVSGDCLTKIKSFVGLCFAVLHFDLEHLIRAKNHAS